MWLPALLLCMAMTACDVTEDETNCMADMQLTFRFTKDGSDQFGVEVPSLSVFVFDAQNRFVGRWDENDNSKFGSNYTMTIPLQPGAYTFVVWGGLKDSHYYICQYGHAYGASVEPVANQTSLSELLVRLQYDTRNAYTTQKHFVDYVPGAQFHGNTGQLTLLAQANNTVTVDLRKNNKKINLKIIGFPEPETKANPYTQMDITLNAPNGSDDFWNDPELGGATFCYVQHGATLSAPDTQSSTFYTMRMVFNNGHRLVIYNTETGREFYSADLLEDYIRKVPAYFSQDAVDAEDEFDITIDVRSNLGVQVSVNGWNVGISGHILW